MEDEHLERTHRGQGALARLLRQHVQATLEHGLVWTEPVGECARWAPEHGSRGASDAAVPGGVLSGRPRATSDAAIRGGGVQRSAPGTPAALGWGGALGPTRERAAMQPCRVEHWDAVALGRWGTAEALQEGSTGGPTLHRVVALLHAAHLPLHDDIEGVACGATVRDTHGMPEANTRRAHAYHARGPGASCPAPPVRTARPRLTCVGRTCTMHGAQGQAALRPRYVRPAGGRHAHPVRVSSGRCHASLAS